MERRRVWRAKPRLEGLEDRQFLDAGIGADVNPPVDVELYADPISQTVIPQASDASTDIKRVQFVTNNRTRVVINLIGLGTLEGTTFDPATNTVGIVYDGTNRESQIVGHVSGGNGRVNLAYLTDADVPLESQSGIQGNLIGAVVLRQFQLVDGGTINLTAGVRKLKLGQSGANTQIFLKELPRTEADAANTLAGVVTNIAQSQTAGESVILTDGNFFPVFIEPAQPETQQGPPPGVRVQIDRIRAVPRAYPAGVGDPVIFGYDPAAGLLLPFNGINGQLLGALPVASLDADSAGVSLGQVNGQVVVLVGQANIVRAFDALTMAPVGAFTTSNLGFTSIDALAKTDTQVVLVQAGVEGDTSNPGMSQIIDLGASLATGTAVGVGNSFDLATGVTMTSGATGVAGFEAFAVSALAPFDQFQPGVPLPGIAELSTTNNLISQQQLTRAGVVPNPAPPGGLAFGSVNQVGLVNQGVRTVGQGTSNMRQVNVVTTINPESLSSSGSIFLEYAGAIGGLSESFIPGLAGAALIDVQGDIQAFISNRVSGMVLNDSGQLNAIYVNQMSDSFIIGYPVLHVDIPRRNNVTILSTNRPYMNRGGVTVIKDLPVLGPLNIP